MPPPHAKPGMCQPVNLDPARLIFINETDDEYAPSIRRRSVWPALGLIGPARSLEDVPSPRAAPLDGAVNGTTSRSYSNRCTSRRFQPAISSSWITFPIRQVVGVHDAIEARGAKLLYLPPYSPDVNPIEQAFAKFKALRKIASCSVPTLTASRRKNARTISPMPASLP
jgi:hypothetical protein